jgi:hypothetical protein
VTRLLGWAALGGVVIVAVVVAATAPSSAVPFRADEPTRRAIFDVVAGAEPATRVQTARNFPGDLWSADDDFHNAELRMAHAQAAGRGVGVPDVLRAIDEGLRAHWPVPGPPPLATSPPCHPRPEY